MLKSTRSMLGRNAGLAALAAVLAVQLFLWQGRRQPSLPLGPSPGDPVPELSVGTFASEGVTSLPTFLATDKGCDVLVIVSPTCPTCARMRTTWPRRFAVWADSVGHVARPVWLGSGGHDEFRRFTMGFSMPGVDFAYIPIGSTGTAYRLLGVIGTPTVYLVDRKGIVRGGWLGDVLPPPDLARAVCA